jgi:hypothetical protein
MAGPCGNDFNISFQGEADIFEFAYKTQPSGLTDRESEIYLVLKDGQILDYEAITLFSFKVEAQVKYIFETKLACNI